MWRILTLDDAPIRTGEGDQTVNIGLLCLNEYNVRGHRRSNHHASSGTVGGEWSTPNVDHVVQANKNPAFREAINGAMLRVPDGMWIVYASRLAGTPLSGTVTGRLLLPAVAKRAAEEQLPIALYGAGPGVAEAARDRLVRRYPGLQIVAAVTPPPNLTIGSAADLACVDRLLERPFAVLFVALGAPKQELWRQAHVSRFGGATAVGVGAAFDIDYQGGFRRTSVDDEMGPRMAGSISPGTTTARPTVSHRRPLDPVVGCSPPRWESEPMTIARTMAR